MEKPSTRTRILVAAADLFVAEGYQKARLAQVAKVAEVSRSTLYEHFPGKDQLLVAINHQLIDSYQQLMQGTLAGRPSATDAIHSWLETAIKPTNEHKALLKLMFSDEVQSNLLLNHDEILSSMKTTRKLISKCLRQGVSEGEFISSLNINATATSLQNLHSLLTRQAAADHALFDFGKGSGTAVIELIMRGIVR